MSDLISREAVLDALKAIPDHNDGMVFETLSHALRDIELLPSAHPDSCEYCNEDANGFVTPLEKNGHAFVRFGMNGWELSLRANGWHGSAKIRYCPMCGRDLFVKCMGNE